jgi:hypothetical protein
MGNAKFYFYPKPSQTPYLSTIDLGEPLAELFSDYEIDAQDGVSYTGRRYRTVSRISEIVRIQRDRMIDGEDKAADLITLQSHLDRGYSTLFAADSAKAHATYLKQPVFAGDTVLTVSKNVFRNIVGNQIVVAGDYLMIESENPNMRYQLVEVQSITATATADGTITLASPILYDFDKGTIGVRHYRFWPSLKRPVENLGQNMITNERGFLWSLDVTMTPDYVEMFNNYIGLGRELGDISDAFGDALTDGIDSVLGGSGWCDIASTKPFDANIITEPTITNVE